MKATENGHRLTHATLGTHELEKDGKRARRMEKAEARIRLQAELRPDPRERFRILTESIKEARQVVDLSDHRARYALVIIGVLNAGVFAVLSRGHLVADLPAGVRPWLIGAVVVYGLLTLAFVFHAIDCLRPRPLTAARPSSQARSAKSPLGLLFWEAVAGFQLDQYHAAWDEVRMAQINAEAEAIFHTLAGVVRSKYRALHRLYIGMTFLVILAALLLAATTWIVIQQA